MSDPSDEFLLIGAITSPFGLRGEVKVRSLTDRPEHLQQVKQLYLGPERRPVTLRRVFEQKPGTLVLGFQGITTRNQAEELRGQELYIADKDVAPLDDDEYFLHQLPGTRVVTVDGREIGRVIDTIITGANEVLVVHGEYGEVLVPMIKDVVKRLDFPAGMIEIDPLPGML